MIAAIEEGSMASMVSDSSEAPLGDFPAPRAIAPSKVALGRPDFLAVAMRVARRGLVVGSGPCTICE